MMLKRHSLASTFLILFLLATTLAAQAETYNEAVAAYNAGNYAKALRIYKRLAQQGDARAQFEVGQAYRNGLGVPQDDAEAVRWYRQAAEWGLAVAQYNLAVIYRYGIPQDEAEALKWFRNAAAQDHAKAQAELRRGPPGQHAPRRCDIIRKKLAMTSSSQHKKQFVLRQWGCP